MSTSPRTSAIDGQSGPSVAGKRGDASAASGRGAVGSVRGCSGASSPTPPQLAATTRARKNVSGFVIYW